MGTGGSSHVKAVKYFNEIEETNIKKVDSIKNLNQKLRLTFSLKIVKMDIIIVLMLFY